MPCYVSSTNNRFYVGLEQNYGAVGAVTEKNRIPAVKLEARQKSGLRTRRDKTGSRTFAGLPSGVRRTTDFALETFLTAWTDQAHQPSHGPLFQAAMGGTPKAFAGATVSAVSGAHDPLHSTPRASQTHRRDDVGHGIATRRAPAPHAWAQA